MNDSTTYETSSFRPLVLITDDNAQARLLLRRILEREGFRAEEASDGAVAIEKSLELSPELILMDIQMAGMDGFETVQKLRSDQRTARIPVIVVTAAAREPSDVTRGFGLGADDYLLKPFNTGELVARVNAKIRARRLEERLEQRSTELETLVQIGTELNQNQTLPEVLDRLFEAVQTMFPSTYAMLAMLDQDGRIQIERQSGMELDSADLLYTDSLPGYVLRNGEALLIRDTSSHIVHSIFRGISARSGIAALFKHQGQTLGIVAVGSSEPFYYSTNKLRVLRSIAEHAALAIRNAQLYTRLEEYAHNLESMVEARTKALQAAQVQLLRADKLAALGTLAAGVAHEVNNPLQPLLTNLELAIEDLDWQRPVDRELLELAKNDVQRIQRIVSQLLDFARPAQSGFVAIDVNQVVRDVLALTNKQLEHARVKVAMTCETNRHLLGNVDQLRQVILNLIVNARDAMPSGGRLDISLYDQDEWVVIRVQDNGAGIPPEDRDRIFDPFFTTKPSGTGLGLSISHSIVAGHGGRIEVESEVEKYAAFTIYLPALTEGSGSKAAN